ncbi:hypothetical protein [Thalassobius sp. Cn5-15]|uniref:hypothetical protein n=1 Tax=Thalassobius sp. Cn5-15 TaxID=2917763 RepID=UPI001EF2164A|nr:hypothetical protein [Thalassobius sp. Cn5-15]MCG7494573.1 hypothetical protein [Thalassobius sp. Cn5-15]
MPGPFKRADCPTAGGSTFPKDPLIADQPFDGFEIGVLHMLRLFWMAWQIPQSRAWIDAFSFADRQFGPDQGPLMARAVLDISLALGETRRAPLRFYDPYCRTCSASITKEENHLISSLYHFRRGTPQARAHSMMLCEGEDEMVFHQALARLLRRAGYLDPNLAPKHASQPPTH